MQKMSKGKRLMQEKKEPEGIPLIAKQEEIQFKYEQVHVMVSPDVRAATLKRHLDVRKSNEFNPPEGRNLFFEDGKRRIDYVLAWKASTHEEHEKTKSIFESNLESEGLMLEYDVKEGREMQYVKVHAPWEVLTRYAGIMKVRVPIKEVPEEIRTTSVWEAVTEYISVLFSPFAMDPSVIPPIPKTFTHSYEKGKDYLFAVPKQKELFFSHTQRSRIVDYILRRKRYGEDTKDTLAFGIKRLLNNQVYTAAYPLHEGSWKPSAKPSIRKLLYSNWASWGKFYKVQPLDYIRIYFGEKIGLYFAWLGYYTYMLLFASVVGIAVFLYGCFTLSSNIVAQESCDWNNNFTMCPKCELRCPYWNYAAVCLKVKASHLFDNGATVFFAIFMSLWGMLFLELWKREQVGIQFKWNTMTFEEEEEPPRPEFLIRLHNSRYQRKNKITGVQEPFLPFWRRRVPVYMASASTMLFLIAVAMACIIGVYVYRMAALMMFYRSEEEIVYKNATLVTSITAACINLVVIFILSYVYTFVAYKLTDWECLRTQSEYDSSLTIKLYILQFVNYYSSLFYIAFFKGRFTGRPGDYNTLFGARQEECSGGGCLMELCIQLAVIFVGKQLMQNVLMEIIFPRIMRKVKIFLGKKDIIDKTKLQPWEKDFILAELGTEGLFREYLEMMIQFGFVTIFVAAFPLAPVFALINNILEIRIDANKFITQFRRPLAVRTATIGVWYDVMYGVSRLAILTNAFIIAFTTGFIHRLVYSLGDSEDGTLTGYVNYSLSYFNVSDFQEISKPDDPEGRFNSVDICRYQDYREPPGTPNEYEYTIEFWHVLAAQFIFVVTFENVVIIGTNFIAYVIPDIPQKLKIEVHREAYLTNEIILKTELEKAKGLDGVLSEEDLAEIRDRNSEFYPHRHGDAFHDGDRDRSKDDPGGKNGDVGGEKDRDSSNSNDPETIV